MRLLVVGHPLVVAYNQKKYVAMKRIDPSLQLRIVVPKQNRHPFGTFRWEVHPELNSEEVVALASVFSQSHMTYVLDPVRMAWILRQFRPEVIHVEEEPHAGVTVATTCLRDALLPRAAITLFTWDNLHRSRRFPLGALKRKLRSYTLRRAAAVVCGNRDAERLLRMQEVHKGYTVALPQFGLDPSDHTAGTEPELRIQLELAGSIVVGYMGRMVPEKGILLLLAALAKLTQYPWKLVLVGSGPLEQEIHEHWIARFPGRIVHVRAVLHQEVPRYLRCLDVFVLASYAVAHWREQFGLTLAQAMMLGIPSVVSSCGAIPEVVGPGGLIFEEGKEESLREALQMLFSFARCRRELGARAREFALRHYTIAGIAARYLSVFEQAQSLHATARSGQSRETAVAESNRAYHS